MAMITDRLDVLVRDDGTHSARVAAAVISASCHDLRLTADVNAAAAASTLCLGRMPLENDPAPVVVRARPLPGEQGRPDLQVCVDTAPSLRSSAGYADGIQQVGVFLPPPTRRRRTGEELDLHTLAPGEVDLTRLLGADSVRTPRSSVLVPVLLAAGATVELHGSDDAWPLRREHLAWAFEAEIPRLADGVRLRAECPRARDEPGAGPRVGRLVRQAAYLPF